MNTDINHTHINDIYRVGNKGTIILEFISNLPKRGIFKEVKKLKGTGISITNDLCKEDQRDKRILYNNLKEARSNDLNAYIKQNKLYVNGKDYTAQQLKNIPKKVSDDLDIQIEEKTSSAPPTPTIKSQPGLLTHHIEENHAEIQKPSNCNGISDQYQNTASEDGSESQKFTTKITSPKLKSNRKEVREGSDSDIRTLRNKKK